MTFENTAWAIDGALLGSSLARRAEYAAVGGAEGVVQKDDLKVTQLAVPGVGFLIGSGVGLLNNRYQDVPNETYVVSNPGAHTFPAVNMPAADASERYYLVVVAVGDPAFSQSGHPFMGSDDPPVGEEQSFDYVRPVLVQVDNGSVTELPDATYPHLVLARLTIPANTTTITNNEIDDLRHLARPRQSQEAFVSPGGTWTGGNPRYIPAGSGFADWGPQEYKPEVHVPEWATRAILLVHVNGVRFNDQSQNIKGRLRAQLGSVSGPQTIFDYEASAGGGVQRDNLMCAGEYDVSGVAGQDVFLRVEGYQDTPGSPSNGQRLRLQGGSQMIFDVRFFEE